MTVYNALCAYRNNQKKLHAKQVRWKNFFMIRIYDGFAKKIEYFGETLLNGQNPLKMWSLYERPASLTTTKSCENWHNIWNKKFVRFQPNFWVLIQKLKREDKMSKLALKYFPNGDIPLQVCFIV